MDHWKVILEGHGEADTRYVYTKDGEVIGTWTVDENEFYDFTPNGAHEPLFTNPFLGLLCATIDKWHKGQQAAT